MAKVSGSSFPMSSNEVNGAPSRNRGFCWGRAFKRTEHFVPVPTAFLDMNATLILLLSSLLMGTSFLSEVPDEKSSKTSPEGAAAFKLLTGAASVRGGCLSSDLRRGQYAEDEDDRGRFVATDGGRPPPHRPPRRKQHDPYDDEEPYDDADECRVRFGLHYASCFSKSKDFDDKLDQLQHRVQSWPRGDVRGSNPSGSPCSTLQLLAKVKSSPLFERCQGNQYVVRTPYHMYNVKGELRYIVQDPPNLEQCYLEAQCSIPGDLCRGYLGGYRGRAAQGRCESRHCHHTLLAWDPDSPDSGTFFDVFEYSCCCSCMAAAGYARNEGRS